MSTHDDATTALAQARRAAGREQGALDYLRGLTRDHDLGGCDWGWYDGWLEGWDIEHAKWLP